MANLYIQLLFYVCVVLVGFQAFLLLLNFTTHFKVQCNRRFLVVTEKLSALYPALLCVFSSLGVALSLLSVLHWQHNDAMFSHCVLNPAIRHQYLMGGYGHLAGYCLMVALLLVETFYSYNRYHSTVRISTRRRTVQLLCLRCGRNLPPIFIAYALLLLAASFLCAVYFPLLHLAIAAVHFFVNAYFSFYFYEAVRVSYAHVLENHEPKAKAKRILVGKKAKEEQREKSPVCNHKGQFLQQLNQIKRTCQLATLSSLLSAFGWLSLFWCGEARFVALQVTANSILLVAMFSRNRTFLGHVLHCRLPLAYDMIAGPYMVKLSTWRRNYNATVAAEKKEKRVQFMHRVGSSLSFINFKAVSATKSSSSKKSNSLGTITRTRIDSDTETGFPIFDSTSEVIGSSGSLVALSRTKLEASSLNPISEENVESPTFAKVTVDGAAVDQRSEEQRRSVGRGVKKDSEVLKRLRDTDSLTLSKKERFALHLTSFNQLIVGASMRGEVPFDILTLGPGSSGEDVDAATDKRKGHHLKKRKVEVKLKAKAAPSLGKLKKGVKTMPQMTDEMEDAVLAYGSSQSSSSGFRTVEEPSSTSASNSQSSVLEVADDSSAPCVQFAERSPETAEVTPSLSGVHSPSASYDSVKVDRLRRRTSRRVDLGKDLMLDILVEKQRTEHGVSHVAFHSEEENALLGNLHSGRPEPVSSGQTPGGDLISAMAFASIDTDTDTDAASAFDYSASLDLAIDCLSAREQFEHSVLKFRSPRDATVGVPKEDSMVLSTKLLSVDMAVETDSGLLLSSVIEPSPENHIQDEDTEVVSLATHTLALQMEASEPVPYSKECRAEAANSEEKDEKEVEVEVEDSEFESAASGSKSKSNSGSSELSIHLPLPASLTLPPHSTLKSVQSTTPMPLETRKSKKASAKGSGKQKHRRTRSDTEILAAKKRAQIRILVAKAQEKAKRAAQNNRKEKDSVKKKELMSIVVSSCEVAAKSDSSETEAKYGAEEEGDEELAAFDTPLGELTKASFPTLRELESSASKSVSSWLLPSGLKHTIRSLAAVMESDAEYSSALATDFTDWMSRTGLTVHDQSDL